MGTAQQNLSLEVCYFLIFSCLVHLAQPSPACSIRNRDAEYRFQVLGRCFEHIGRRTWEWCADHCQSSGGVMAKIDEHTITEDTAPKFAKIMEFLTNNDVLVGFRVGWGGAEWMDGTTVTVPDVEMMMPSFCGLLYIDDYKEEITYFWMALPCKSSGYCVCEYAPDTTADVHADETAGVGVTTTEVPVGQTTTTVPEDATTTTVPVDSTTTTVPMDSTTTTVPVDSTTTILPLDSTTTTVPVDSTTTTVPVDSTTTTVPVDSTTTTLLVDSTTTTVPVDSTTTTVPVDSTTAILPVDSTTTTVPVDSTTLEVPVDQTTTEVPFDKTTISTPVDSATGSVSYGTITDAQVDKTTEQIGRPQTNRPERRESREKQKHVLAVAVQSNEPAYIIGEAMSESRCGMVTMCSRICQSNSQCVRFNFNTATGECRLFNYNTGQRFKDHPDWTVWDKMSNH